MRALGVWLLPLALVPLLPGSACAQISLYTAADLALRNSSEVHMAEADVARAISGLTEAKDAYIPNFVLGAGLGYSYGFPVGQPSIFNGTAQSVLLSFSQPDYIRSARASLAAARYALDDTRQRIVTESALEYAELDSDRQQLAALREEHEHGERLVEVEEQRAAAGFGSRLDVLQAQLREQQLELRRIHLQDHADLLAAKLAHLTGMPASAMDTETKSIPPPPDLTHGDDFQAAATRESFALQSANASAISKQYVARGDSRQVYRPEIFTAVQYARYAKFNNYDLYYLRFQHNNFGAGVQVTLPLFDAARREKARGSAADAMRAREEVSHLRDQVSEQALELQKSTAELVVQQRVAELQSEIAREQLSAMETELQSGTGNPNATPVTPRDAENARIEERQRYVDMLDAKFQLLQAQLNLLRALGRVEDWARQRP